MPFFPLHDRNALKFIPFQIVTVTLIVLNCLIYLAMTLGVGNGLDTPSLADAGGLVLLPASILQDGWIGPDDLQPLMGYAFLHGGPMHLIGNMAFLWVFGDNVEDRMGHLRFLVFYLLCAAAAGLAHIVTTADLGIPVVGASGAVAGILGAYIFLFPRIRVWVIVMMRLPVRLPAFLLIGGWIAYQVVMFFADPGGAAGVAWATHVGGFATGLFLAMLLVPKVRRGGDAEI